MTSRSDDLLCRRLALSVWKLTEKLAAERLGPEWVDEVVRRTYGVNNPDRLRSQDIGRNFEQFFELAVQAVGEKKAAMDSEVS